MINLGENIKKLRELKNFTQQYLADELGLSLSGYGKIERNQTELSITRLYKICEVLEVDLQTLLSFDGKELFKSSAGRAAIANQVCVIPSAPDRQSELIEKYKEENLYLKQLVQSLLEKEKCTCLDKIRIHN